VNGRGCYVLQRLGKKVPLSTVDISVACFTT